MLLAQDLDAIQASAFPKATFGGASTTIGEFITKSGILTYVFGAAAILLLVYLVIAGLGMMLSRGDPKAMQAAQGKITNALIGFIIVFFAFALVALFGKILGIAVFGTIFG